MKKLLLLITALFILASVEGQILRYSNYTAPAPPEPETELRGPDELYDGHSVVWLEHDTLLTESGGAVSAWTDIANGYQLIPYATDGSTATSDNYPSWTESNGVVFDGTDDVLKYLVDGWGIFGTGTVYAVVKQVGWAANGVLFSYAGAGSVRVGQKGTTPEIRALHSSGDSPGITNFTIGTIGILVMHVDGSNNTVTLSLNNGTPVTNTADLSGFYANGVILGATRWVDPALQRYGNVAIYAIIYRDQIDTGATLTAIYNYLDAKY